MNKQISPELAAPILGLISGIISYFVFWGLSILGWYLGPGIVFALIVIFYLRNVVKTPKKNYFLWIIICTFAYFIAFNIVFTFDKPFADSCSTVFCASKRDLTEVLPYYIAASTLG